MDSWFRAMRCFGHIHGIQFAKGLELASYSCHNKLPQRQQFKPHKVLILHFCRSEIQWARLVFLLQVHMVRVRLLVQLASGVEPSSGLVRVVGRIDFHVVIGLRSLSPRWLLEGGSSQLLEAAYILCFWSLPPSSKLTMTV